MAPVPKQSSLVLILTFSFARRSCSFCVHLKKRENRIFGIHIFSHSYLYVHLRSVFLFEGHGFAGYVRYPLTQDVTSFPNIFLPAAAAFHDMAFLTAHDIFSWILKLFPLLKFIYFPSFR